MKFLKLILWFLDQAGLVDQLTQFLVNLYEEQEKPTDAISYMRKALAQGKKQHRMFLGGTFDSTLRYEKYLWKMYISRDQNYRYFDQ